MIERKSNILEGWMEVYLGDKDNFQIIGSGIDVFTGIKEYLSTSSIEDNKVVSIEQEITYKNRPSRANMQPVENSVWFAKMKNTFKIMKPNKQQIHRTVLSTGFCGILSYNVDCNYLLQVFSSDEFNNQKNLLAIGSTQEAINSTKAKLIHFLLPSSLPEQKKISEILSTADKAIEETEMLIAKYQRIKTGLMQDLLTKGIDENGNIRSEETHEFKDSPLGRIPVQWKCDKLDSFLDLKQYGVSIPLEEQGITPILRMNNIVHSKCEIKNMKYSKYPIQSQFILNDKDILFNRTNSIEHVGRTGIFRSEKIKISFASYLVRLVPKKCIDPEYFNLLMNYKDTQNKIKSIATSAVHQANVNPTNLGNLYFVFPKMAEQKVILEILNNCSLKLIQERKQKKKLKKLKTGLMQDLLSGKVRVNDLLKEET